MEDRRIIHESVDLAVILAFRVLSFITAVILLMWLIKTVFGPPQENFDLYVSSLLFSLVAFAVATIAVWASFWHSARGHIAYFVVFIYGCLFLLFGDMTGEIVDMVRWQAWPKDG